MSGVLNFRRPELIRGQENQHIGMFAEALAVLSQKFVEEFGGVVGWPFFRCALVEIQKHEA